MNKELKYKTEQNTKITKNSKNTKNTLNRIRKEIQLTHLVLIIIITILLSLGGVLINVNANDKALNQNLQDTAELMSQLFLLVEEKPRGELIAYIDTITKNLTDVDVLSIVDTNNIRIYHTNHALIGKKYDGKIPYFSADGNLFYTENDIGPSGPQRRCYSALYNSKGEFKGFIMTIMLKKSIRSVTQRIVALFLTVTLCSIIIEIIISRTLSRKIKRRFLEFADDLEGTKYLVDSMRANNHDFTNKLHVILGLIQIGEYERAVSYIENISIIQRETISSVMKSIENPSFAALLIGKIARASECNVKFILKEGICYRTSDIDFPTEALITICGNLIDNALDSMNILNTSFSVHELTFGVYTKPKELLITVQDTGCGIKEEIKDKIFDKGFSTKGEGRGTGLYHIKQLIEGLGGTINFESQAGSGTVFVVAFKGV